MPRECLSHVALGQRYCLRGAALREAFAQFAGLKGFEGTRLRPGKRQAWTPITGFKGFKVFKGFKGFKRFKGFKGLRAGKRQAWTPIRSH